MSAKWCGCLQVVQPNPANKQVYTEALARHMLLGKQLFAEGA
jgi:hypothetical protein